MNGITIINTTWPINETEPMVGGQCQSDWFYMFMMIQSIFLLIFGFGANICSFSVLIQPRLRRRPTFSYLAFLSLSNAFLSLIHAFFTILGIYFDLTLENLSLFIFCRLINRFLIDFLTHFSLCTLAAVDFDRVKTVTSKTIARRQNSQSQFSRNSRCAPEFLQVCLTEFCFAVCLFFLNLHWLTSYGYTVVDDQQPNVQITMCTIPNQQDSLYVRYLRSVLPTIDFFIAGLVPFLVSLITTIIILRHVSMKDSSTVDRHIKKSRRRMELHLSILLISLNCVFLLFTTPHNLFTIYVGQYHKRLDHQNKSEEYNCSIAITQKALDLLQQCFFMSTFFLYILTNCRFRAEFYRLLKCRRIFHCRSTHRSKNSTYRRNPENQHRQNNIGGKMLRPISFGDMSDVSHEDYDNDHEQHCQVKQATQL